MALWHRIGCYVIGSLNRDFLSTPKSDQKISSNQGYVWRAKP